MHRRAVSVRSHRPYGEFDFAEDKVYEAVEDLILVGDLVVQRHRFGVQGLGQGA